MDKYCFRKGDIVKLSNECLEMISRKRIFSQNLFRIMEVDGLSAKVSSGDIDVQFHVKDILPVKIDGVEDRDIYYDPVVTASVVGISQEMPVFKRDRGEYYLNALKRSFNDEHVSYYDIIRSKNLSFVHEIQQQIPKLRNDLKIHYHITGLFSGSRPLGRLGDLTLVMTYTTYTKMHNIQADIDGKVAIYVKGVIKENEDVASLFDKERFKYVVVCSDKRMARYIVFLMNSPIGKLLLIRDFKNNRLNGTTNVETIKKMPVYYIEKFNASCLCVQDIINCLKSIKRNPGIIDVKSLNPYLSFFERLRSAMVLEMMLPQFFQRRNLKILDSWKNEVDKLNGEVKEPMNDIGKFAEFLSKLINSLMTKGNELTENMMKLKLYTKELLNAANKKMKEEK